MRIAISIVAPFTLTAPPAASAEALEIAVRLRGLTYGAS